MNLPPRILLIDDDATYTFLLKRTIAATNDNVKLKEFDNGQSAIGFLNDNKNHVEVLPDIILLDLNMPIMNGWGFLKEYALAAPTLPKNIFLYIVSSSISSYDIEKAKHSGLVTDFLIKPVSREKINQIIKLAMLVGTPESRCE
jgi:CheY-like chemotaxis protein